ncbi:MAG: hypothetical protein ABR567_04805 [Myxococcales bacterium]|nr:hypothetical protein [Myxococcales bacterium]
MKLTAEFASAEDFLAAHEQEIGQGGLLVRGAELPPGTPLGECTLAIRIAGAEAAHVQARLAAATPGVGVMVIFPDKPAALNALATRLTSPRKETLSLQEKMALAMSGDREMRFQLLRDPNKQIHPLVLKNPRIGLEEVVWAAKLTTINPEALKVIADHPEWGQNPTVAAALVRNPKTPIPVAVKLVPRLAHAELKAIARSQGRPQVVQAAKKHLAR